MSKQRNDIHRMSQIDPSEYEYVGYINYKADPNELRFIEETLGDIGCDDSNEIDNHIKNTGGEFFDGKYNGHCTACGTRISHAFVFYHADTNTYIKVGETCGEKMEILEKGVLNKALKGHELLMARAQREKERQEKEEIGRKNSEWRKANWTSLIVDFLKENEADILTDLGSHEGDKKFTSEPEKSFTSILIEYEDKEDRLEYGPLSGIVKIAADIIMKALPKREGGPWSDLSDKQIDMIKKAAKVVEDNRKDVEIEKGAEDAPADGERQTIEGEVLSIKVKETQFGDTLKALIRDDRGFKVWGTRPATADESAEEGDRVKFVARLNPSNDDPKFAFFKRPTKVEVTK